MPRLANGPQFPLKDLSHHLIQDLIGATEHEDDSHIEMLFIRLLGDHLWHRIFLQAGIGFWEYWTRDEAFRDYEDCQFINFTERWNLTGCLIHSAMCVGRTWDSDDKSRFEFVTERGTITLSFTSDDLDSPTRLRFAPST